MISLVYILGLLLFNLSLSAELDPLLRAWERRGHFPEKVLMLRDDGSVVVEKLREKSLKSLKSRRGVIYIQAPRRLKPANEDYVGYSTLAIWGSGASTIQVQTQEGQNLKIIPFNTSLSIGGSCIGSPDNLSCSAGLLNINTSSSADFRILIVSTNRNLSLSHVSGGLGSYYVGTGALISGRSGKGVVVGIVDSGINFCHPLLRGKVIYFYEPQSGLIMDKTEIDRRANAGDCNYDDNGHGTRVAGIISKLAPDAQFIVVRLTEWIDAEVIEGLNFIRERTSQLGKPVVVNLSLSGHFDPHDGTGLLDRAIDLFSSNGRIVVSAASNEGDKAIHAQVQLSSPTEVQLISYVSYGDIIDGWHKVSVKVELCKGSVCTGANPGDVVYGDIGNCPVYMDNSTTSSPLNGDGEFVIDFYCSGNLTLRLTPLSSAGTIDLYLTYPYGNSEFLSYTTRDNLGGYLGTVGAPGTSKSSITVGAITNFPIFGSSRINERSFSELGLIAFFSSRGPTRDGRIKPDISAGGLWVYGAMNDGTSLGPSAGTSFSAPIVSAIVAQLLESSPNLSPTEVKNLLCSSALKDNAVGSTPNNTYGCGKAFAVSSSTPSEGGSGGGGCYFSKNGQDFGIIIMLLFLFLRRLTKHEKTRSACEHSPSYNS